MLWCCLKSPSVGYNIRYIVGYRRFLFIVPSSRSTTAPILYSQLLKNHPASRSLRLSYLQHGCLCSKSYSTSSSPSSKLQPGKLKILILIILSLAPIGFVWYYTRNSNQDDAASIIATIKKELLYGQRAHLRQDYQTAEHYYHRALELLSNSVIAEEKEGIEARAATLDKLANLYLEEKKWVESENTFRELLRVMLRAGTAKDSNAFVEISLKLARIYHNQKRYKVAEAGFDWCVSTMREKCTEEKTDERLAMLCMSLLCRATFYRYIGRHTEAITDYTEQVNVSENIYGKDSIEVAVAYSNLAVAVDAANHVDRALELIKTSLAMAETLLKDATCSEEKERLETKMASFNVNLATIQCNKGQYSLALEAYSKAEALTKKYPDEEVTIQIHDGRKICNTKLNSR